jgi:hypothetical protein
VGSGGERQLPEWYSEKGTIQKFSCGVDSMLFFVMLELYPLFLDCPFELAAGQCYKEHAFHLY